MAEKISGNTTRSTRYCTRHASNETTDGIKDTGEKEEEEKRRISTLLLRHVINVIYSIYIWGRSEKNPYF